MVRTEPFKAQGKAKEVIETLEETEDFVVEEVEEDKIVIKGATVFDLDYIEDDLMDRAAKNLKNTDFDVDEWLNNKDYNPDKEVGKESEHLHEAHHSLKNTERKGESLPYTGDVRMRQVNAGGIHEVDGFEKLADEEARKEVIKWLRNTEIKAKVEVREEDGEYEVNLKGVESQEKH